MAARSHGETMGEACVTRLGQVLVRSGLLGADPATVPRIPQAQQYVVLRRPYLVNDVFAQDLLLDRRLVYRKLVVGRGVGGGAIPRWGPGIRWP